MTQRQIAIWMMAGFAVCLVVVAVLRRPDPAREARSPQQSTEAPRPSPIDEKLPRLPLKIIDEKNSVRTRKAEPGVVKAASQPAAPPAVADGNTDWAVVAAIYKEYEPAERRARSFSSFSATVYPSRGQGSKYMVVLGSGLTRTKAEELRSQATGAGLPPDTYVTRLRP